jgi:hypothetical protein
MSHLQRGPNNQPREPWQASRHYETHDHDLRQPEITGEAVLFGITITGIVLFFFVWCAMARIRMKQTAPRIFLDRNSGYRNHQEHKKL